MYHLWLSTEDYSIQSLTGIPPHASSSNGAIALPSWDIFSLLPELFQCSSTPVQQVCKWLFNCLPSLLSWSSVQYFSFFSSLASAKVRPSWCHTLKVALLCWDRPSLRCRLLWSSGYSFWRFWWPTIASYTRERLDLMLFVPPLDPLGLLGSCVCNPQLPSPMYGSAYQASLSHFKKDDSSVKSIFFLVVQQNFYWRTYF